MNSITNLPKGHTLIETEDGSSTFFSEAFQEACHSTSGARSETLLHYVEGCQIKKKALEHEPLVILEVGFGLGVGLLTTFEVLQDSLSWHFLSLELDRELLEWFRLQHGDHEFLKNLKWITEDGLTYLRAQDGRRTLTVLLGNARETLPHFAKLHPLVWHAIYQDAFSPKKNPTLWTKEWFSFLKSHSHERTILSTYSASTSIRKSLVEAGWGVLKGEKFGPKRTSTRAVLNSPTDPEILLQLQRSPTPALCDDKLREFLGE